MSTATTAPVSRIPTRSAPPTPTQEPAGDPPARRRTGLILAVPVLAAVSVLGGYLWLGPKAHELRLSGVVEVQDVRLGSKVNGRVAEVLVREGDHVTAGTPLVRLALPELAAQREQLLARLDAARAEKQKADAGPRRHELDEAKAAFEVAQAKLGRARLGWRDEEKRQAKFETDAATADLTHATRELLRVESLVGSGGVTGSEIDRARGDRERAAARHAAAKSRHDMLAKGGWQADIDEATAERDRLKARYDLLRDGTRSEDKEIAAAQVRQLDAQVRELDAQLAEATIAAAESCMVEVLAVRKGDLVTANQPVVRVLRADDLWVRVYVPEPELGKVRLGQPARVTLDAYPNTAFAGEVVQIATISEFTPRNVQSADQRKHQVFAVKVRVADPRGIFKSGLAAEVVLPLHGADQ